MSRSDDAREAGFTVLEVVIASAMLIIALSGIFAAMVTSQRTAAFAAGRHEALNDMRLTADTVAKDVRQASQLIEAKHGRILMQTYVRGVPARVSYQVEENGGQRDLVRRSGSSKQVFVVKLADTSVFAYDSQDPVQVRRVRIILTSKPTRDRRIVELSTEATLRNA